MLPVLLEQEQSVVLWQEMLIVPMAITSLQEDPEEVSRPCLIQDILLNQRKVFQVPLLRNLVAAFQEYQLHNLEVDSLVDINPDTSRATNLVAILNNPVASLNNLAINLVDSSNNPALSFITTNSHLPVVVE